ncbi:MAG: amidase [Burkholderiales bacterium]|nr:amidase [Burkholderiales bacterium]
MFSTSQTGCRVKFDEYRQRDAMGLAELVRKGEVTATELLQTALSRLEAVNPQINSVVIRLDELARRRAQQSLSGPFAGVPFLTKDLFQEMEGAPNYNGCQALKRAGHVAPAHAEITRRWLDAGVVIFGRTNTPEFGAKGVTEPHLFGPTRNPWDIRLTPGGSSGGSAAAVASGVVPMAGANDGGGSIRIPAACCGLFGLKPGRGRNPWGPDLSEYMHGGVMNHVLTRSVRDSAAMLDATQGPELGSLALITPPERPYLEEVTLPPGKLRIAFSTASPIQAPVHSSAIEAVRKTAQLLSDLGHHVEEAQPELDQVQAAKHFITIWLVNCALFVQEVKQRTGCGWEGFEPDTRAMAEFGLAMTGLEYLSAHTGAKQCNMTMAKFFQKHDLWLTPTLAAPPGPIGSADIPAWQRQALRLASTLGLTRVAMRAGVLDQLAHDNLEWLPFTQLANITGLPAMSMPLFTTETGLPSGVHFTAPMGREGLLYRLAGQLEQAQPWAGRFPKI